MTKKIEIESNKKTEEKETAGKAKEEKDLEVLLKEIEELKKKIEHHETENKDLEKKNKKYKEEYLRQLADKENLRKRLEREKSEFYLYALSETLKEFLVILDNFERALGAEDQSNGKSFQEGIEMIYRQLKDLLVKQGVQPIEIKGKRFDPHYHQAFTTEESDDVEEAEISEVLQRGYLFHDRLLRPSLVKVVVPKKEK